jgi:hypothetical protein
MRHHHHHHPHPDHTSSQQILSIEWHRGLAWPQRCKAPEDAVHLKWAQQGPSPMGHDQQVTVMHTPSPEAMAPHPHVKGAQRMGDEQTVQVQR